jgi:uncharacterized protein (TIGR00661 family)
MKKVIVAPLNWGLGHATRCVPIIKLLLEQSFEPVIASDGKALMYLKKEFPTLETLELPSYQISYAKHLKWHLFLQVPKIRRAVALEKRVIAEYINAQTEVVGIISDNRFGVRSAQVPSVYITHQINVLSGWSTFLTSYIHQRIIRKFDECWVPDETGSVFSGKLSQNKKYPLKFIGILSRFKKEEKEKKYDVAVVLSGVEPQRTLLEKCILEQLVRYQGKVLFVKGVMEETQQKIEQENIMHYNFMLSEELQDALNASEIIVSRAGYSSIMDAAFLHKSSVLIPTKHQTEQEYLGRYLAKKKKAICVTEEIFSVDDIHAAKQIQILEAKKTRLDGDLFSLFERK